MSTLSRRELIAGVASTAVLLNSESVLSKDKTEFMFEPGLNYLNTAALGPTPRSILDIVLQAWHELELDPVMMAYGAGATHVATDRAREQIATLIGCSADELLLTRSATDAMNSVALGIDLKSGDRVLTTDVEHEGGTVGWEYLKRRRGVNIDLVSIPPGDFDTKAMAIAKIILNHRRQVTTIHDNLVETGIPQVFDNGFHNRFAE